MKKYEVVAPFVVFSAQGKDGKKKEYSLKKGDTVDLPEASLSVQALLVRKQIKQKSEEQKQENKQL
jgi:hypothetical protein